MFLSVALAASTSPVFHYIRSNGDGSLPEHVVIRRPSRLEVETFKYVQPGTASAYVTCIMEDDLSGPKRVRSWRLTGKERKLVAWIDASKQGGFARVKVVPTGEPEESVLLPPNGWHIFNMDLGSLVATLAAAKGRTFHFSFIEPNLSAVTPVMLDIGTVTAARMTWESREGRRCRRWELTGGPLKSKRGSIWMTEDGWMVAASIPLPNHQGYRDFSMKLVSVSMMTSGQWGSFIRDTVQGRKRKAS